MEPPEPVAILDRRDHDTARHSAAVGRLCRQVAVELGWPQDDVVLAHLTGLAHDVGKAELPGMLLRKPERLTPAEWRVMRRHAERGADALAVTRLPRAVVEGVRSHHERWDGSGYPRGLRGDEIPALGRLVGLCDSYDAMVANRPFRTSKSPAIARHELAVEAGILYDPAMTEALLVVLHALEGDPPPPAAGVAAEWRRVSAGLDTGRLRG